MILRHGDSGDQVKALQRGLNQLGSILLVDGGFGDQTGAAVVDARGVLGLPGDDSADDGLQAALAAVPDPFPPLTAPGVTFIARLEVTSPQRYRQAFSRPTWPSAGSGVTIGIGYDLEFVDRVQFAADWSEHLSPEEIEHLSVVLGQPGSHERLAAVSDLHVPLLAAMAVFLERSLPQYLDTTRSIYPQIDALPPNRRTSLVSLVYNRGARLQDRDPAVGDRREMRNIRDLLAAGNFDPVAGELESMTRLWEGKGLAGLVQRRRDEASLWRSGFAALQLD